MSVQRIEYVAILLSALILQGQVAAQDDEPTALPPTTLQWFGPARPLFSGGVQSPGMPLTLGGDQSVSDPTIFDTQASFVTQGPPESGGLPGRSLGGQAGQNATGQTLIPPLRMRFSDDGSSNDEPESGGLPGWRPRPSTDELGTIPLPGLAEPRPYQPNMGPKTRKINASFGEGLEFRTTDGYFTLVFHNLTQVDYRAFNPTGDPLHDSFIIPRQRWYFVGNISPYVRYYTVINRGYGSLDLLDAFIDVNLGVIKEDKLQFRFGRMKTPYTYEYIKIAETDLIAPERSLFVGNLAGNRQDGVMAHGVICDNVVEYAVGVFNGPRRSFQDYNSSKDLYTFLHLKPFVNSDCELLSGLNVSGSFNCGDEHNPLQPSSFTTANDQSTSSTVQAVSPTFFTFNSNVFENGPRAQWAGDVAYYFRSFGMLAGYQGGFQDYGISATTIPSNFVGVTSATRTQVPLQGYSIAMFYFLTGEQITRRVNLLEPKREYDAKGGTGAVELFARFANMSVGSNVFSAGLANAAEWSNRANATDLGVNWYVNHYTKLTFDWQYAEYGKAIYIAPGRTTNFNNLFWLRAQVYF